MSLSFAGLADPATVEPLPKVYHAFLAGRFDDAHPQIQKLREPLHYPGLGYHTLPAAVAVLGRRQQRPEEDPHLDTVFVQNWVTCVEITLREGKNRQIRRLCQRSRLSLRRLHRVALGPLALGGLGEGDLRRLTRAEVIELYNLVMPADPVPMVYDIVAKEVQYIVLCAIRRHEKDTISTTKSKKKQHFLLPTLHDEEDSLLAVNGARSNGLFLSSLPHGIEAQPRQQHCCISVGGRQGGTDTNSEEQGGSSCLSLNQFNKNGVEELVASTENTINFQHSVEEQNLVSHVLGSSSRPPPYYSSSCSPEKIITKHICKYLYLHKSYDSSSASLIS
mmetsp:Transcript_23796/g.38548  ORF Transcript_23796/g.38548 Transcript_23796/m.38548 type:complete len:334 (-) Transcript_23796:70-1071(-)